MISREMKRTSPNNSYALWSFTYALWSYFQYLNDMNDDIWIDLYDWPWLENRIERLYEPSSTCLIDWHNYGPIDSHDRLRYLDKDEGYDWLELLDICWNFCNWWRIRDWTCIMDRIELFGQTWLNGQGQKNKNIWTRI